MPASDGSNKGASHLPQAANHKSPPGRCSHSATAVDNGVVLGRPRDDGSSNGQPAFVHFCDAWFLDPQDAQWRELSRQPVHGAAGTLMLLHERRLLFLMVLLIAAQAAPWNGR